MSTLNLVVKPSVEPLDLSEMKLHSNISFEDTDLLVLADITAGRERVELETGRQLITATWELWLDHFPGGCGFGGGMGYGDSLGWPTNGGVGMSAWMDWGALYQNHRSIDIPCPPLQSGTVSITYVDTAGVVQTWDPTQYKVSAPAGPHAQRGRIEPVYGVSWPLTRSQLDAVVIRFKAGYGNTADDVPQMLRRATALIAGDFYEQREATVVTDRRVTVQELPYGVAQILQQFRMRPVSRAA